MGSAPPVVIGYAVDRNIAYTLNRWHGKGYDAHFVELNELLCRGRIDLENRALQVGEFEVNLDEVPGVYARVYELPPHYEAAAASDVRALQTLQGLRFCLSTTPTVVVNRPFGGASNASKARHLRVLARSGLEVPETIVSNNESELLAFLSLGPAVSKSVSSIRTIVELAQPHDIRDRAGALAQVPVLLQRHIAGSEARVHCVGSDFFGIEIVTDAVDYRYAETRPDYRPIDVPHGVRDACIVHCRRESLVLAGFDFRICASTGTWYCLECNPMPGYTGYDLRLGGPINDALYRSLVDSRNDRRATPPD